MSTLGFGYIREEIKGIYPKQYIDILCVVAGKKESSTIKSPKEPSLYIYQRSNYGLRIVANSFEARKYIYRNAPKYGRLHNNSLPHYMRCLLSIDDRNAINDIKHKLLGGYYCL